MKKTTTILLLICVAAFAQRTGTLTDSRDGKKYKAVQIGSQVWMAENLNYNAKGSKFHDYQKYGRLYDWNTAMKACPSGWHLPSNAEWQILVDFAGGNEAAEKKLKAKSGWSDSYCGDAPPPLCKPVSGNGTDVYGFSALEGDMYDSYGSPSPFGGGFWWSSSTESATEASSWFMVSTTDGINKQDYDDKTNLYSVRCIKD